MKRKERIASIYLLFVILISFVTTSAANENESILSNAFKKDPLKWSVEEITDCRAAMSTKINDYNMKFVIDFRRLVLATTSRTISGRETDRLAQIVAETHPFKVDLFSDLVNGLVKKDEWYDPNPYKVPPTIGKISTTHIVFFESKSEAENFRLAALSYAKSCESK